MFVKSRWRSDRLGCEATLARWGHYGQPVLLFPTAGGDAEEIERWRITHVLSPLIEAGKIKIYSCDSVAGRAWFHKEGTPQHRMWMQHQFHQYVRHELVPAIRLDCRNDQLSLWAAGASIGAFHAVASVCRFPDGCTRALAMSGTFNLMRFIETDRFDEHYFVSSPLQFVPTLGGPHLDVLRKNFILFATGAGRAENVGESWAM